MKSPARGRTRSVVALLAAGALTLALLGAGPPTAQAVDCADPVHPIKADEGLPAYVSVGTTAVQTLTVSVYTYVGCDVTAATARISVPRRADPTLTLKKSASTLQTDSWTGTLRIDPATLLNSDAGKWNVRFTVSGAHTQSVTQQASVVRRSRLSFNAGPEPVRNHRLTYTGKLERASWYSQRYIPFGGQTVTVYGYFGNQEDYGPVALPETSADGTYWAAERYRGPSSYSALFNGSRTTAPSSSRQDEVSSPR